MLIELSIRNFALVDDLTVALQPGMTVVTGETGAGKSILIDALGAALGERTGADVIRSGADAASVDAVFEITNCPRVAAALKEAGLADGDDGIVVLSRQVSGGRSACRVNGRPVTVAILQSISKHLVDVHGQHEHQALIHEENHLEFLDNFGGAEHLTLRRAYEQAYHEHREAAGKLRSLREKAREREQRLEMLRYQVEEIRAADVRAEEEDELHAERQRLNSVEKLRTLAEEATALLSGGEETPGATGAVQQAAGNVAKLAEIDGTLSATAEELTSAAAVVSEAEHSLHHYLGDLESDPQRLEEIEGRLEALSRLKRKYGDTLVDVVSYLQSAEEELAAIENFEAEEERLQGVAQRTREVAEKQAGALTKARRALGKKLSLAMTEHVGPLGMPAARFEVELSPIGGQAMGDAPADLGPRGGNECRFLFCANPGEDMRPLVKVASGGELSRIMLAFKSICSRGSEIPSIIFDEIDTGIGGQTAHKVGEKLRELAEHAQVLCVTHLPQIAGLASNHLHVEKIVVEGRTRVEVRALAETERAEELARMLGADDDDTTARKHAERVLKRGTER